jgi:hypothetical protein
MQGRAQILAIIDKTMTRLKLKSTVPFPRSQPRFAQLSLMRLRTKHGAPSGKTSVKLGQSSYTLWPHGAAVLHMLCTVLV